MGRVLPGPEFLLTFPPRNPAPPSPGVSPSLQGGLSRAPSRAPKVWAGQQTPLPLGRSFLLQLRRQERVQKRTHFPWGPPAGTGLGILYLRAIIGHSVSDPFQRWQNRG